jgi:two-component system OmpR family response regulator
VNPNLPNGKKPLSFIIEDDEDLSAIFHEALNAAGFETEIIQNGRLAIDRLRDFTPDVVILDMHLPLVNGVEILRNIRSQKHLVRTSVIVTTADAIMGEQVRDIADFVLIKPISFGQLRDLTMRLKPLYPAE